MRWVVGAPTGKTRYVAYGLSHRHSSVPTDVIEAALDNDFHKYAAHYITVLGDCQQTTFKHLHEAWASLAGRVAKPLRGKCEEN